MVENKIELNEVHNNIILDKDENMNWDQFEANKIKYNTDTNYKEELYTTELNADIIPDEYKMNAEVIEKV